jgi:hypothetical protein
LGTGHGHTPQAAPWRSTVDTTSNDEADMAFATGFELVAA